MSDDMEIMKEFGDRRFDMSEESSLYISRIEVKAWLPDAVKREIVRVLKWCDRNGKHATYQCVMQAIDKYSTPRYCEGMQEAIELGDIVHEKDGYYIVFRGDSGNEYKKKITRCPYPSCPDGENCIGGKE